MTTLYRPVLIESAEQAEALPVDTIAFLRGTFYDVPTVDLAAVKSAGDSWDYTTDDEQMTDVQMVGWKALVPIEAEEETQGITTWPRPDSAPWPKRSHLCEDSAGDYYYRDEDGVAHDITEEMTHWLAAQPVRTRLVTPWEEA